MSVARRGPPPAAGRGFGATTWALIGLAAALFVPLFIVGGLGAFDFWWWMAGNAAVLTALVAWLDPAWRRLWPADLGRGMLWKSALGLVSAAVLYGVFWLGDALARAWFDFAAAGIDAVYALEGDASRWRIGLLIGLLIGPAEEWFWRAFVQRRLAVRHGPWRGLLLATAVYTAIHLGSLNPMLLLAAVVCGLYWGWLWLRFGSLLVNAVSHLVWDLAVFLWFPFT